MGPRLAFVLAGAALFRPEWLGRRTVERDPRPLSLLPRRCADRVAVRLKARSRPEATTLLHGKRIEPDARIRAVENRPRQFFQRKRSQVARTMRMVEGVKSVEE